MNQQQQPETAAIAVARALLPLCAQIRERLQVINGMGEVPATYPPPPEPSMAFGFGASAVGGGIAIGRRVQANAGMICVDYDWLRMIVKEHGIKDEAHPGTPNGDPASST